MFNYFRQDELRLSEFLRSLLDPRGEHAPGNLFLNAFCETVLPGPAIDAEGIDPEARPVSTEYTISNSGRRIDLLVDMPHGLVGIENKPWAGDQENQLADYGRYLRETAGERPWILIYLQGKAGDGPDHASIAAAEWERWHAEGHALQLRYGELLPWLSKCIGLCEAPRVLVFLQELRDFIRVQFEGIRDMQEQEAIVETVLGSTDHLEAALQVHHGMSSIKKKLLDMLEKQLGRLAEEAGWEFTSGLNLDLYSKARFYLPSLQQSYPIAFEFNTKYCGDLYYGVRRDLPHTVDDAELRDCLNAQIGVGSYNHSWVWCTTLGDRYFDWRASPEPWLGIVRDKHPLAETMFERVREIHRALEGH